MSMTKIALLILAHKDMAQLQYLLETLAGGKFNIYLHLDKMASFTYKDLPQLFTPILPNMRCSWGDYNVTIATIELLKKAYVDDNEYFVLMSGQDYPIKSLDHIFNFYSESLAMDYLHHMPLPNTYFGGNGGFDRLKYYFAPKRMPIELRERILFYALRKLNRIQRKTGMYRKISSQYFGGENWFNLSRSTVKYLLEYLLENPAYLQRYKHTLLAEELVFQTILCSNNRLTSVVNNSLRYTKWQKGADHPDVLRMQDLDSLKTSEKLFARKFDFDIDREIVRILRSSVQ